VQTPRRCGQACNAGTIFFKILRFRGFRTNWLIVAIDCRSPFDLSLSLYAFPVSTGLRLSFTRLLFLPERKAANRSVIADEIAQRFYQYREGPEF